MTNEDGFLRALAANPADDLTRLVYADWLDEQATDEANRKAEFLRLLCKEATETKGKKSKSVRRMLQELAAGLEPDWLAVVSKLKVEGCPPKNQNGFDSSGRLRIAVPLRYAFEFVCDRQWQDMVPTDLDSVRFCDTCKTQVHYCATITEARTHAAARHCIAVDLGVIRRDKDLRPRMMWVGRPSAETIQSEEDRLKPDPVSAARETRRRGTTGAG